MKCLSLTVTGLGVLALIMAVVGRLISPSVLMGMSASGLIRGASALFLLALVTMTYGHWYCGNPPPPAKT